VTLGQVSFAAAGATTLLIVTGVALGATFTGQPEVYPKSPQV